MGLPGRERGLPGRERGLPGRERGLPERERGLPDGYDGQANLPGRTMNFGTVLGVVSAFLEEHEYRYALIGGIALASYGLPRTTVDVDLVVDTTAQDDLIRFLESRGYKTLNRSRGYSNHLHSDPDWGGLDFVYVGGDTADRLFAACRPMQGPGGLEIPVPK